MSLVPCPCALPASPRPLKKHSPRTCQERGGWGVLLLPTHRRPAAVSLLVFFWVLLVFFCVIEHQKNARRTPEEHQKNTRRTQKNPEEPRRRRTPAPPSSSRQRCPRGGLRSPRALLVTGQCQSECAFRGPRCSPRNAKKSI